MLHLISELPSDVSFKLFGDRFFTFLHLIDQLKTRDMGYTRTVMSNRTERCPMMEPKLLAKKPRGFYDYQLDKSTNSIVVGWNDNRPVYMASSVYGVHPIGSCVRWSASEKRKITVKLPDVVAKYNMYMGGVDRMDQNIGNYRIGIRSNKWWQPVFVFCVETAVHNAWQLHRKTDEGTAEPLDFFAPLPSNRQYLSCDACLEVKREDNQNCSVLCCVRQLCTTIRTQM